MDLSAHTLDALKTRHGTKIKTWLESERNAQLNRHLDCKLMDIYDTKTTKGMTISIKSFISNADAQFSSVLCGCSAATYVGREKRHVHTWSDVLDCKWY